MLSTDNINFGPNTKKDQNHIICSYGYKYICADEQHSKPYKSYFGEDAIDKFLNDTIKECAFCSKLIETEFNKLFLWLKKILKI